MANKRTSKLNVNIIKDLDDLHTKSDDVDISEMRELHGKLMLSMAKLGDRALGLSAVQIGIHKRAFAVTLGKRTIVMFNPIVMYHSTSVSSGREKCLSVAHPYLVKRYDTIKVRYFDAKAGEHEDIFEGPYARLVQHEMDHLDGVIISDIGKFIAEEKK